ncbi:hypothetical protein Q31a_30430 [Aureliella helgolandensis]|uniref:Amine oxidase domain-containing protein n=1 Tax=Aureliella helgolandensis TaxID=2527968 RepID=A0A518G818_9BACT|nr:hypothetical protein Q31a_30430 [Aureliella helgolandensis]
MLGLTLALRLAERGKHVTILERADHPGGLADAWQLGPIQWDRHYHVTLASDRFTMQLLQELQLAEKVQWSQTKTGFLVDGKLYSMSNAQEFLKFPPLRLIDKIRLGWTIWHASKIRDWQKLERIPIGVWLLRHSGRRTFERIWKPLLKAKLGDAWERTNAAFIWATIQRMYAARNGGQKQEKFGYVSGGYQTFLNAMVDKLRDLNVRIACNTTVAQIRSQSGGPVQVHLADSERVTFDKVVVTSPTPARICPQLSPRERESLEKIEYIGIVCASLLLRKPLGGYYVTNITTPAPFTGIIEMSALVSPHELAGHGLVYLPKYAAQGDSIWSETDDQVQQSFLDGMRDLYPAFDADQVLEFRISRVKQVFPLPVLNYSSNVLGTTTSQPGIYLVNSSQIVNGTLNVNETIKLAESSIDEICNVNASAFEESA